MNTFSCPRTLLTSLLIAPLLSACGALPTTQTLDPPPTRGEPTADPPPLAETSSPARKTKAPRKTKAARKTKAPREIRTAPTTRTAAADPAPPVAGSRHLARLHPDVRRMARALFTEAAAEGIELKFISGYRAFDRRSKKARAGRASWHAFGMAFDINLAHRSNMKDALAHFARDQAQWDRVGAIADRLGLTWGLQWGRHEVFHFEWHPDMPQAIRRPTLTRLLKDAGPDGRAIEKVWRRFPSAAGDDDAVAAHHHHE